MVKKIVRAGFGLSFVGIGLMHFVDPAPFVMIVPPFLPWALALVYISGFFEIAGGIGLIVPKTRRAAAFGLLALLVAVFPANIYMLTHEVYIEGMPREKWMLWARLPFQVVFASLVIWTGDLWPRKRQAT
ncbi:MAG: putative membrane protein [Myxococcota bacterium]|jgi:uncharacterized membrane protein